MALLNLGEMVAEQVKKTPGAVAVIYDGDEKNVCVKITYREMCQRASQVCDILKTHGAQGETVGVCVEPGINLPSVLLGILQASCSYFPFGLDGVGFMRQSLQELGVRRLLLDAGSFESLQTMLLELQCRVVPSMDLRSLGLYLVHVNPATATASVQHTQPGPGLAYCITTSGTTGAPKVVRVPHSCIVPNICDFRKEFQLAVGDITFLTSPLTFDPSVIDIFITLTSGAALLVAATVVKMSPDRLLAVLNKHRVSILQITPSLFRRLDPGTVKKTLLGADSPLRVLVLGGETFPERSALDGCMHPENGTAVYNAYGITELSCWATLHCARHPPGSVKEPVPIGGALTGTKVKVVDDQGEELTSGTGHIWIGGSERTCLLNDEDEQMLIGSTVWRRTGDLGRIDSKGNIFCLGRLDRQIKRHGKRLDLDTLEKVSRGAGRVDSCKAVYAEGRLHLFLDADEQQREEWDRLRSSVTSHLQQTLPSQYLPDCVSVVPRFPVNSHGKLDTAVLLRLCEKERMEKHKSLLPVESWSRRLWQGATGHKDEALSPADEFLTCGGDSLRAVQLVDQVEQHLRHQVPGLLDIVLTGTFGDFLSLLKHHTEETEVMGIVKEPATAEGTSSRELETSGTLPETVKNSQPIEEEDTGALVKGEEPLPRPSQKDAMMVDITEARAKKRRHPCRTAGHGGQLEMFESGRKTRKWHTQKSGAGMETHSNGEISNCIEMSACACGCDGGDKCRKAVLLGESTARTAAAETVKLEVTVAMATSPSRWQGQNMADAEQSSHHDARASEVNVPKEHKDVTRDDVFIRSIGRANSGLLTTHYGRPDCGQMLCHQHWCHEDLVFCEEDNAASNNVTASYPASEAEDREGGVQMTPEWVVNTGKCVDASPLVAMTRCGTAVVYIGSHSHKFFAIDVKCGSIMWSAELGDRVEGSACLSPCGQQVVVGCYDNHIYVLNAWTGEVEWRVKTGDVVKCSPLSDRSSQLVFCGSHDGFLYALHCRERSLVWKSQVGGGGVFASPAVSADSCVVVAATLGGHVTALSVRTGTSLWSVSLGKPVFSSPAMHANRLYVGCVDSALYCLSCATGDQMWVYKTGAPIFSSPVVVKAADPLQVHILFGCHDNHLYCIKDDGQLLWRRETTSTVYAAPFIFSLCSRATGQHTAKSCEMAFSLNKERPEMERNSHVTCHTEGAKVRENLSGSISQVNGCSKCERDLKVGQNLGKAGCRETPAKMELADCHCDEVLNRVMHSVPSSSSEDGGDVETEGVDQYVACASTKGRVTVLSCATGKQLGSITLPGDVFSSPVIVSNCFVVGCRDDNVYCYKLGHC